MPIEVQVDGTSHEALVEPRLSLAGMLNQLLGVRSVLIGCDTSNCGACTVLLNGEPVKSCTVLAVQSDGHEVQTAAAQELGSETLLGALKAEFMTSLGFQCGYCTPGMLMAAQSLLQEDVDPTDEDIREAIDGNLCRCTGYVAIVDAIRKVSQRADMPRLAREARWSSEGER